MASSRFHKRWALAHKSYADAVRKQYGNLDIPFMLAIDDAKLWLERIRQKREALSHVRPPGLGQASRPPQDQRQAMGQDQGSHPAA